MKWNLINSNDKIKVFWFRSKFGWVKKTCTWLFTWSNPVNSDKLHRSFDWAPAKFQLQRTFSDCYLFDYYTMYLKECMIWVPCCFLYIVLHVNRSCLWIFIRKCHNFLRRCIWEKNVQIKSYDVLSDCI